MKYKDKEIREIFDIIVDKNPGLTSYICFSKAIKGREYDAEYVEKWFKKLVDKEDYQSKDYGDLMDYLKRLTFSHR